MNRLHATLFSLIFIVYIFASSLCLSQYNTVPDSTKLRDSSACDFARITLQCAVNGLTIYVDQDSVGVTPLSFFITPGSHHLTVPSPHRTRWQQNNWRRVIEVKAGEDYLFNVDFLNTYLINTLPFEATVFANGEKLGTTPLTVFAAPDSQLQILIQKKNFKDVFLLVGEQEEGEILLALEYEKGWQEQTLRMRLTKQRQMERKRRGLFSSIAFSTITGLSTIYFRDRANDEYSRYLHAGLPNEMDKHYDRTKHYDKLAGLSYALFQIGFVLTGYFFLSSRAE